MHTTLFLTVGQLCWEIQQRPPSELAIRHNKRCNFDFAGLPSELRDIVCDFCLPDPITPYPRTRTSRDGRLNAPSKNRLALMRINTRACQPMVIPSAVNMTQIRSLLREPGPPLTISTES
jgi:hypothetical protein